MEYRMLLKAIERHNKPMQILGIVPTIRATHYKSGDNQPLVLVTPKSTNTQTKSIEETLKEQKTMATLRKSTQKDSQTSTVLSVDSLAKLLASLENDEGLKIPEERYFLTLREYCEQNNLDC